MDDYLPVSDDFAVEICKALGLNPMRVQRVILDFQHHQPVAAYVEMYGTSRLYEISWADMNGAKIEVVE